MPIPSGALYPGESENHRAAERERRAERPRPTLSDRTSPPLPRKKPTAPAPAQAAPGQAPTPPPDTDQPRRTWRDLDATEINRF